MVKAEAEIAGYSDARLATPSALERQPLPDWWLRFIGSYPAVPNVIAVAGLAFIMFMLAPTVTHPSENGGMIDSLAAIVTSHTIISKAIGLRAAYHHWVPKDVRDYAADILFNSALYFVVPFLLVLEFLFPGKPSQPLIGKGFLQDAIWFAAAAPTVILVTGIASEVLRRLYDKHLGFLTISSAVAWPTFLQVIAALLVVEFLWWMSHLARHKVHMFWLFHAVHHSQTELNVFTEDRVHFVDALAASLIMFIPFYIFQVPNLYAVAVIGLYRSIHARFLHANVKINLGWIGWLIASPQFHRVHHSGNPAHEDKNFGVVLSIFDHLFGTAHPSRDIYPETGINDARFPIENNTRVFHLPANWLMQTIFPFLQFFKQIAPHPSSHEHENAASAVSGVNIGPVIGDINQQRENSMSR
jgi:sterol desaturase/sphingolipid hydroxylase (fatty acid hydroxylase superfamily)